MRKVFIILCAFVLIILSSCDSSATTFEMSTVEALPSEEFTVKFSIHNNPGFIAYQMNIVYDNNILMPLSITKTAGNGQLMYNLKSSTNNIEIVYAGIESESTDGILFKVSFKVSDKERWKSTEILIENLQFFDSEGHQVEIATNIGTIINSK